jgi:hypothetical protein
MKYVVSCNCYGFRGRYWCEGEIVEVNPKEKPPEHFKCIDKNFKGSNKDNSGDAENSNDSDRTEK